MAINSLGIGSGVLTSDVIDQLKAADSSRIITPLENKITLNNQKQDAHELLTSLMKTFKASASALSFSTVFDKKTVDVSGNATVELEDGASVESFSLETTTLAKKDIINIGSFSSKDSAIASGNGVLTVAGFDINYTSTTTLSELAQLITDEAGDSVAVSVLETGDSNFSLILSSKSTGSDQSITITDTDDGSSGTGNLDSLFDAFDVSTNPTGFQHTQTASDASFKFNGVTITRSSNTIDDLVLGMSITLKEEGDISSVTVAEDTEQLTTELQLFSDSYNALISNLNDMTIKDEVSGAEGIFSADSFVKSITKDITDTITIFDGNKNSLLNFGFDIGRDGTMSFSESDFTTAFKSDPDTLKSFFIGGTDSNGNETTGIFENIDDKINSYTGFDKLLSSFETDLENAGTNLSDSHTRATATLDNRYEIMSKQFAAYDAIINRINAEFASLKLIIESDSSN